MKLFSVIVPVYKVEEYLPQCIESVLGQTYTDFELILVDDGSPDNCGKICDSYAKIDPRIRVIHKINGGVTSARLAGAEAAVGTYIVCVDGDDGVKPDYLKRVSEYIEKYAPCIICCSLVDVYEDKSIEKNFLLPPGNYDKKRIRNEIFPLLIEREDAVYFPNNIAGKAIRRDLYIVQQKAVDQQIRVGEDSAVTKPCIYNAEQISVLSECLYCYRQNPKSMTKCHKAFDMNDPMRIGKHLEKQIDVTEADLQAQIYRNVVHGLFNAAASQFYRQERYHVIVKDIERNLHEPYYQNAIKHCCFRKSWKGTLAKVALRYRLYGLIWLYSRLK